MAFVALFLVAVLLAPFFVDVKALWKRAPIAALALVAPLGVSVSHFSAWLPLGSIFLAPFVIKPSRIGWFSTVFCGMVLVAIGISWVWSMQSVGSFSFGIADLRVLASFLCGYLLYHAFLGKRVAAELYLQIFVIGHAALCIVLICGTILFAGVPAIFSNRLGVQVNVNPNILSCLLDLAAPISAGLTFRGNHSRNNRIIWVLITALLFASTLLSQSRGGLLGLVVIAMCFWLAVFLRFRKLRALLIIAIPVGLLLAYPVIHRKVMIQSPNSIVSNMGRILLLQKAKEVLDDQEYFYGAGIDAFKTLKMTKGFPDWFDPTAQMSSHNIHLEFLLGWGAVGLAAWVSLLGWLAVRFSTAGFRGDFLGFGALGALGAFTIHGMVDSLLVLPYFMLSNCLVAGVAVAVLESTLLSAKGHSE